MAVSILYVCTCICIIYNLRGGSEREGEGEVGKGEGERVRERFNYTSSPSLLHRVKRLPLRSRCCQLVQSNLIILEMRRFKEQSGPQL